jgi:tight adherence protein C
MNSAPLLAAGAAFVLAAFLLAWVVLPQGQSAGVLEQRLARVADTPAYDIDLVTGELTEPAFDRIVLPILGFVGKFIAKRTKEGQLQQLRQLVAKAGSRQRPETLLALRLLLPLVGIAVGWGLDLLAKLHPPASIAVLVGLATLMYLYPTESLKTKAKKRQTLIRRALPGALDLLTVCMEAGLSLDMAIMRVSESDEGVLSAEFQKVINEVRLGRPRAESLMSMAERNDVEELTGFIRSVIQAEPLGVSIANVLRIQSEDSRRMRKQRAEQAGHRAPILMLFPMMCCIFPCIFLMLLGPAALQLLFH